MSDRWWLHASWNRQAKVNPGEDAMKRYVVSSATGGWLIGNRRGYATVGDAIAAADRHQAKHPSNACVIDLYEFRSDHRDHVETIEYLESPALG